MILCKKRSFFFLCPEATTSWTTKAEMKLHQWIRFFAIILIWICENGQPCCCMAHHCRGCASLRLIALAEIQDCAVDYEQQFGPHVIDFTYIRVIAFGQQNRDFMKLKVKRFIFNLYNWGTYWGDSSLTI